MATFKTSSLVTIAVQLLLLHHTTQGGPLPGGATWAPPSFHVIQPSEAPGGEQEDSNEPNNGQYLNGAASGDDCQGGDDKEKIIETIQSAITRFGSVEASLNKIVKATWSNCQTSEDTLAKAALDAIEDNINTPSSITGQEPYSSCSYYQQSLNSSIPYLKCFSGYISDILIDLTNTLSTKSDDTDDSSTLQQLEALRQHIYDSYENVTGILDMLELVDMFPCQQTSNELLSESECLVYDHITIDFREDSEYKCFANAIDDVEMAKQISVATKIAYFLNKLVARLDHYNTKCVKAAAPPVI